MMEGWKEYKLGDLIDYYIGGGWGNEFKNEDYPIPAYVIRGTDIEKAKYGDYSSIPFRYHKKSNFTSRKLQNGDIIFEVSGGSSYEGVGKTLLVKDNLIKELENVICASFCKLARPKSEFVNNSYLNYLFEYFRCSKLLEIWELRSASNIVNYNWEAFLKYQKINLPPLHTQRKIAKILSTYDDLIENNLKRIKLLEEMAQKTYEEWFVRFKFPGHETAKFDKETGLPEGWKYVKVGNLLSKIKSTTKIKTHEILEKGEIPVIDQSREFIKGYTNNTNSILNYPEPLIVFGDHTRILKFINFPFARGADGTQILLSKDDAMPQHLFYHSLLNIDLSNYHYARHFKFLKDEEIIIPKKHIAYKYEDKTKIQFELIKNLRNQNQRLKEARDILLPRLMTGMIDVEKIEMEL